MIHEKNPHSPAAGQFIKDKKYGSMNTLLKTKRLDLLFYCVKLPIHLYEHLQLPELS